MTGFKITSLLHNRWLWGLAALFAAIPALVLAWLYWWVFPNLPRYKDDIAGLLSAATGYVIRIDGLEGEWGGARPRFSLQGVAIAKDDRPVLYFSKMEGSFGWRTLLSLEPRFHSLHVDAPGLTVRRTRDGMIHVGGVVIDPNSPATSFSDWLLKQGEVRLEGLTVAWIDERVGGEPLVLNEVSLTLRNLLNRHAFELALTPPAQLARPLSARGVLYGRSLSRPKEWHGRFTVDLPAVELSAWRPWLPQVYENARGHGSIGATLGIERGQLAAAELKLNLADLHLAAPAPAAPADLARLTGTLGWAREKAGQRVYARGAVLAGRTGAALGPFDASYGWGGDEFSLSAARLDLGRLAALAPALPLPPDWRARILALAPRGQLDNLELRWRGELPAADTFSVDARFAGLAWNAADGHPGAANLSGMLAGDEDKGSWNLSGRQSVFELPSVFPEPRFVFDTVNARGGWKRQKDGHYVIDIAEAALSNADFAATLYGRYRRQGEGPGYAELNGRVERASGPRIGHYLPYAINADTHDWLRSAILKGEVREGSFRLQGDLARFPFRTPADGSFRVSGRIHDGQLRFAPAYPQIEGIEGELAFDGVRMEIRAERARIFGAQLARVKAVIADLEAAEELLEVDGEAAGPAQEFIRFVNFSPVSEMLDGLTEEMTATGNLRLRLGLKLPLRHLADTTLAGRLVFDRNTVYPGPDIPRMEQVSGVLDFTQRRVTAKNMSARILGGPALVSVASDDGTVRVRGQGSFAAAALDTWLGKDLAGHLSGQSAWQGELVFERGLPRLRLESNLVGLASGLPAPLAKTAERPAAFVYEQQSREDGSKQAFLQYGSVATAVWRLVPTPGGARFERGELNFGGRAQLPAAPGLQITGSVKSFDLGGWTELLPEERRSEGGFLSGIDLNVGSIGFLGRQFNDINVSGGLRGNLLRVAVSGSEMNGNLTYRRAEGGSPSRLSAQFRQFVLPEPLPYALPTGGAALQLKAANLPALDLDVEELRFGSRPMGRLQVLAHGVPDGMAIDQLSLVHDDSVIRMNGSWKDTGLGETRMKVQAEIKDAGLLLARFGYANALRKGTATVEGEVSWARSPADFSFDTLDGKLRLKAGRGQFLKVEPGAGKLLGIASLQSLPRRIALDFRDVFSEGFAFDEISSTMQVADGTVYTSDFLMKGPAANVRMSGMANLKDESVKLRVKVTPKLSEGVAMAGALLGGPVAGVGALVVQKVLKDPFEEAISYEYLIEGPWDNPAVTRLARAKPAQEKETQP